jgi:hypothetical protein
MRTLPALALLLTVAQLGACQSAKPVEEAPKLAGLEVLPNLPLPPEGTLQNTQSSPEAMQVVAVTEVGVDSVLTYYRTILGKEPFRLINETTTDSITSFYVEQAGPSLWITVRRNGSKGSMVVIAGASADTSAAAKAKATPQP